MESTTTHTARHTIFRYEEEDVDADFNYSPQKCRFGICKNTTQVVSVSSWPSTTTEIDEKSFEQIELDRQRRKKDREAKRVTVDGMERTVDFDVNLDAEKELVSLCSCSSYDVVRGIPLRRLGLFLKREYNDDQEEEEAILVGDDLVVRSNPTLTWAGTRLTTIMRIFAFSCMFVFVSLFIYACFGLECL